MRRFLACAAAMLSLLALSACASPEELRVARAERDRVACDELGFEPGSETFALCLLIQDTNRRIDVANQQLRFLESDLRRQELLDSRFHRRRW